MITNNILDSTLLGTVAAGDQLLTIEAMKMETTLYAEIDGAVAEIVADAGARVEAKDLLIAIDPA